MTVAVAVTLTVMCQTVSVRASVFSNNVCSVLVFVHVCSMTVTVTVFLCICHGHGHGHGIFILATHPKGT